MAVDSPQRAPACTQAAALGSSWRLPQRDKEERISRVAAHGLECGRKLEDNFEDHGMSFSDPVVVMAVTVRHPVSDLTFLIFPVQRVSVLLH